MPAANKKNGKASRDSGKVEKELSNGKSSKMTNSKKEISDEEGDDVEDDEEEGDEEEYVVEGILDHKIEKGKHWYKIKWLNYGPDSNSWEPEECTKNCEELVDAYWVEYNKSKAAKAQKASTKSASKGSKPASKPSNKRSADSDEEPDDAPSKKSRSRAPKAPKPPLSDEIDDVIDSDSEDVDREKLTRAIQAKYKTKKNWEDLVEEVETMDQGDDKQGMVAYIKLLTCRFDPNSKPCHFCISKNESLAVPFPSKDANKRCPQQVIAFYERHLQFKST